MKKYKWLLSLLFIWNLSTAMAVTLWQAMDKAAYFEAIASDSRARVDKELDALKMLKGADREAYEGALLMKKAGLVLLPKDKLRYFKQGRIQLETVLQTDNNNAEYRFLRLIIEEHAPKIVKYRADLAADAALVRKEYRNLPPAVQHAVLDYSKTSKVLSSQDFK